MVHLPPSPRLHPWIIVIEWCRSFPLFLFPRVKSSTSRISLNIIQRNQPLNPNSNTRSWPRMMYKQTKNRSQSLQHPASSFPRPHQQCKKGGLRGVLVCYVVGEEGALHLLKLQLRLHDCMSLLPPCDPTFIFPLNGIFRFWTPILIQLSVGGPGQHVCPVPVEGNGNPECVETNGKDPVGTKGERKLELVYTGVRGWVGQETSLVD